MELPAEWYRTCQECGHRQPDKEPTGEMTTAYRNRKCKVCKSESLDYGTYPSTATGEFRDSEQDDTE